jgi:hypothetical protein
MSDEEPLPTTKELAEAEALARALEGGAPAGVAGPEDALAAAALLRRARDGESSERQATEDRRIADGVVRALTAIAARRSVRPRRRWLAPLLLVPAAAAAVVLATARRETGPSAPPLPAPPLALLETQARAASGRADLSVLDREMRTYRESVYATLGAPSSTGGGP